MSEKVLEPWVVQGLFQKEFIKVEGCQCYECLDDQSLGYFDNPTNRQMVLCVKCGNKRCPHATNHTLECTNSNEVGQKGSRYEHDWKPDKT